MPPSVDPRDFGRLEAEVEGLRSEVAALRVDVRELLELANKGRGAFWIALTIGGTAGSVVSFIAGKALNIADLFR